MFRSLAIASSCLCLAATVYGQSPLAGVPYASPQSVPGSPAVLSYGYSSTLQEGIQRGAADLARGYGEGQRSLAEAACYAQTAAAQQLQNHRAAVELFWQKKELYEHYRRSATVRWANTAVPATYRRPVRKETVAVDSNGAVDWPAALRKQDFKGARDQLQTIFTWRSAGLDTSLGTDEYRQAKSAIAKIRGGLKKQVRNLPPWEYAAALGHLRNLETQLDRGEQPLLFSQR